MLIKIKQYLIRLFFFLSVISVGLILTGSLDRNYDVASRSDKISCGNEESTPDNLAKKYIPNLSISSHVETSELNKIYYEIIEESDQIVANYYYNWNSENSPNIIVRIASKIWRFIHLRFVLSDIEYIQLNIDKMTGKIRSVKTKTDALQKLKTTPCFEVNSWNHNISINPKSDCSNNSSKVPLAYFDNSEFKHLKMARRSQGDFKTEDSIMNYPFIIFLALLATYYFRHLQKDYNNEYASE